MWGIRFKEMSDYGNSIKKNREINSLTVWQVRLKRQKTSFGRKKSLISELGR